MFFTMKSVYLLVLMSLCQGLPLDSKAGKLKAPQLKRVNVIDPPAIEITWDKIQSPDADDPVIGYKVKVWEVQQIKHSVFVDRGGDIKELITTIETGIDLESEIDGAPYKILVPANVTTVVYKDVQMDITYEIRVQAYTRLEDSPLSDPVRVTLSK